MLEQLARDVTGWPAHAVEFFEQLATTQYMNHVRLHAPATADLRSTRAHARRQGGPFNAVAHTAEMRRPESGAGRYNIPNIGIFLWRLQSFRLTGVPLTPDPGDASGRKFRVNPLGADLQLFRRAADRNGDISHLAEPVNVPEPLISAADGAGGAGRQRAVPADARARRRLWRAAKAWCCCARQSADSGAGRRRAVSPICATSATAAAMCIGWNHEARAIAGRHRSASIRERGRVLLGARRRRAAARHASTTAPSRPIGGGEYERTPAGAARGDPTQARPAASALQPHLDAHRDRRTAADRATA